LDHVNFPHKKENVKKLVEDGEEQEDFKPFPTLVEALSKVDPDVGFNVEVKYPMMQTNGEHECDHYFERNEFIDVVLADLLNNAGSRRIMFSSFDPDICSLISMKQNKYPVLFLCVGETQRYTRFQDQRSSTSLTAVNFAAGADIMVCRSPRYFVCFFCSEALANLTRPSECSPPFSRKRFQDEYSLFGFISSR
ncbi:hypothetical protein COOONC_12962, partial [Cooperia oncophora]